MLALIQRVDSASVDVDGEIVGEINKGFLVLLGVVKGDGERDADLLAAKISGLRIFEDNEGKMNISVKDAGGSILVVSQFTLAANCKKGRRPGFDAAAPPEEAERLCDYFTKKIGEEGVETATGRFAAHMKVSLINNGPVTIWLDSMAL